MIHNINNNKIIKESGKIKMTDVINIIKKIAYGAFIAFVPGSCIFVITAKLVRDNISLGDYDPRDVKHSASSLFKKYNDGAAEHYISKNRLETLSSTDNYHTEVARTLAKAMKASYKDDNIDISYGFSTIKGKFNEKIRLFYIKNKEDTLFVYVLAKGTSSNDKEICYMIPIFDYQIGPVINANIIFGYTRNHPKYKKAMRESTVFKEEEYIEESNNKKERLYKCPYCNIRKPRAKLPYHIDKYHSELVPEKMTSAQIVFNTINKKDHGTCSICGKETRWREDVWHYDRFCSSKCKDTYVKTMKQRMINKYGTPHLLNDMEQQEKMLSKRSISGEYKFKDGGIRTYCGSYERKLLEFYDQVLNVKSDDIMTPGPIIEYEWNGATHKFITDLYYIPANLVHDVKDGGDNPNTRPMQDYRDKQIAKEKAIMELGKFNYIRLTNNDFKQLMLMLADLKERMMDDNHTPIFNINEYMAMSSVNPMIGANNQYYIIPTEFNGSFTGTYISKDKDIRNARKIKNGKISKEKYNVFNIKEDPINESLFITKKDYVSNLDIWGTKPGCNILWITGLSGSGKTTTSYQFENENVEIIHLDDIMYRFDTEVPFVKHIMERIPEYKKCIELKKQKIILEVPLKLRVWMDVVNEIFYYSVDKFKQGIKIVVEGVQIFMHIPADYIMGCPLIVKNTSMFISMLRAIERDGYNSYTNKNDKTMMDHLKRIRSIYNRWNIYEIEKDALIGRSKIFNKLRNDYKPLKEYSDENLLEYNTILDESRKKVKSITKNESEFDNANSMPQLNKLWIRFNSLDHNTKPASYRKSIGLFGNNIIKETINLNKNKYYDKPYSYDEIVKQYGKFTADRLSKDPVHKFRMDTGIELIHQEPSTEELKRIWNNWNLMNDKDKNISDTKSIELFGMDNKTHYNQLLNGINVPIKESNSYNNELYNSKLKDYKDKGNSIKLSDFRCEKLTNITYNKYKEKLEKAVGEITIKPYTKGLIYFDNNDNVAVFFIILDHAFDYDPKGTVWVSDVYIAPKYRGYHLTKQILDICVNKYGANTLGVYKTNKIAIKAYTNYGFKISYDYKLYHVMVLNNSLLREYGIDSLINNSINEKYSIYEYNGNINDIIEELEFMNPLEIQLDNRFKPVLDICTESMIKSSIEEESIKYEVDKLLNKNISFNLNESSIYNIEGFKEDINGIYAYKGNKRTPSFKSIEMIPEEYLLVLQDM